MSKIRHKDEEIALKFVEAGVFPYLVGPAGSGKTTIAENIAKALGLEFYYASGVDSEYKLKGFIDAHGRPVSTPFIEAFKNGGVFLFDELDAANPQAIVTAHAALDNGILDAPGGMIKKHKDFHYIAAANTYGHGASLDYIGRNPLDGATLDRYTFLPIDYDNRLERQMVINIHGEELSSWVDLVQTARAAAEELGLRHIISPRASRNGAALIKAGVSQATAFHATVLKGLDKGDVIKLQAKIHELTKFKIEILQKHNIEIDLNATQELIEKIKAGSESLRNAQELVHLLEDNEEFLRDTFRETQEAKKSLDAIQKAKDSIEKVDRLKPMIEDFIRTADSVDTLTGSFRNVADNIDTIKKEVKAAQKTFDTVNKSTSRMKEIEESLTTIERATPLVQDFLRARGSVGDMTGQVTSIIQQVTDAQKTLQSLNDMTESIKNSTGFKKSLIKTLLKN